MIQRWGRIAPLLLYSRMSIVINIFGAPGVGKTTMAASLFVALKKKGVSVDAPYEHPKEMAWLKETEKVKDQYLIMALQHHSIFKRFGKVDYIIMDSPVLMSIVYAKAFGVNSPLIERGLWDSNADRVALRLHSKYPSLNFHLKHFANKEDRVGNINYNERFRETEDGDLGIAMNWLLEKYKIKHKVIDRSGGLATILTSVNKGL